MTRRIVVSLLVLAAFLAAASTVLGAVGERADGPKLRGSAGGSLRLASSSGEAMFSLTSMAPGDEARGSLTISKEGSVDGAYSLSASTSGSRLLAQRLELTIYRDVDRNAGAKIYEGPLASLGSVSLGDFAAGGDSHTYYFEVSLPSTGSSVGDNALQGLSATASFSWSARQV